MKQRIFEARARIPILDNRSLHDPIKTKDHSRATIVCFSVPALQFSAFAIEMFVSHRFAIYAEAIRSRGSRTRAARLHKASIGSDRRFDARHAAVIDDDMFIEVAEPRDSKKLGRCPRNLARFFVQAGQTPEF